MKRAFLIWIMALMLCTACSEPKARYDQTLITQCNMQCRIDSDCTIAQSHCFGTRGLHKEDLECFAKATKNFHSTIGRSFKCEPPKPADSFRAICQQNTCIVEEIALQTPIPEQAPPKRGIEIITPPVEVNIKPDYPPFYVDRKWQFADYIDPPIASLGPDYISNDKPFVAFNTQGEMWGHDGTVFFHRLYTFDDETISFSSNPKFCYEGECFDRLRGLPKPDNQIAQSRFMGRYDMQYSEDSLSFENLEEEVKLKRFVPLEPLPPLPKNLALCEIRDMQAGETFPDYKPATFKDIGYTIRGSDETLWWDHIQGPQVHVEIVGGKDVQIESKTGIKILRRLTPYHTNISFGPRGLYCMSGGSDRKWSRFMKDVDFNVPDYPDKSIKPFSGFLLTEGKNYCVQIENGKGRRYTPVFSKNDKMGYDDFGFYLENQTGGKRYRIGDNLDFEGNAVDIDPNAGKNHPYNRCSEPFKLILDWSVK